MNSRSEFRLIIATQRSVTETKLREVLESLLDIAVPARSTIIASTYDPSTPAIAALARELNLSTHRVTAPNLAINTHIIPFRINERLAANAHGCVVLWDGKDGLIKHLIGAAQFHSLPVWSISLG